MTTQGVLHRLRRCAAGSSIVELAFALPLLLMAGLGLSEMAALSIAQSRVNQIAISVADNASRAKQSVVGASPQVREYDVNETFKAADLQFPAMELQLNGRVVLSSLETNAAGGQWIHWQRCHGNAELGSSDYGQEGLGVTGTGFPGMGPADNRVAAEENAAIMFAEVKYRYRPLFFHYFIDDQIISKAAAMYVRDDRDLTQIYNPAPAVTVKTC